MENEKSLYSLVKIKEIDDDEDFIQQVISIFLETVPENTGELVKACNEENWEQVYFYAHKIKSNVNLLSIDCILDEIKFVEQSAKNRINIEMIPAKVSMINETLHDVTNQIKNSLA